MKKLSERLREVREINGLRQPAVAAELNVKPATISRYECGTSDPDTDTLLWYAKRFGVSMDWLFGLSDDPAPRRAADPAIIKAAVEGATELTEEQIAERLPEEIRDAVLALIRIEAAKK